MPPQSDIMDHLGQDGLETPAGSQGPRGSDTSGAPRSVYLTPIPLARELSDLSGSYANGTNGKNAVPNTIYQELPVGAGPWRLAYIASQPPPPSVPLPVVNTPSSLKRRNDPVNTVSQSVQWQSELVGSELRNHNRIPVNVVLMDGPNQTFELLQLWIDRAIDSVRDIVQAVQRGIPGSWKVAYDGIFQIRGNRFTQMIHILKMAKYDIQPNEILIAKPGSMTAKVTISYATSAIRHLKRMQIIVTHEHDRLGLRRSQPKSEDSLLLLSTLAQKRIYLPNGVLTHHHATQFLSFSPPFNHETAGVDQANDDISSNVSSLGMGSHFQGALVDDLITSLQAKTKDRLSRTPSTTNHQNTPSQPDLPFSSITFEEPDIAAIMNINQLMRFSRDDASSIRSRQNSSCVMSQLNCWKSKERVAALSCCPHSTAIPLHDMTFNCCKTRAINPAPLPSVEEENYPSLDVRPLCEEPKRHRYKQISVPSLSGIDTEPSIYYVRRGNTRVRLIEI